jgi:hypothetical protein
VSDEIEVTEEMIEAGAEALMGFSAFFEGHEAWAKRCYLAMDAVRRRPQIDLRGLRALLILEEGTTINKSLGVTADTRLVPIPGGAMALALRAEENALKDKILLGLRHMAKETIA